MLTTPYSDVLCCFLLYLVTGRKRKANMMWCTLWNNCSIFLPSFLKLRGSDAYYSGFSLLSQLILLFAFRHFLCTYALECAGLCSQFLLNCDAWQSWQFYILLMRMVPFALCVKLSHTLLLLPSFACFNACNERSITSATVAFSAATLSASVSTCEQISSTCLNLCSRVPAMRTIPVVLLRFLQGGAVILHALFLLYCVFFGIYRWCSVSSQVHTIVYFHRKALCCPMLTLRSVPAFCALSSSVVRVPSFKGA